MLDMGMIRLNVAKTEEIIGWLRESGDQDQERVGRMGADLGDAYVSALRYRELLDAVLKTSPGEVERLSDLLSELYEEMRRLNAHLEAGLADVDTLADRLG